jgi:hypothetical protein
MGDGLVSKIGVFPLAGRMLDRDDNDLTRLFVNAVIDEVGIAARDNLPTAKAGQAKGGPSATVPR